jgi:hypothetical protein
MRWCLLGLIVCLARPCSGGWIVLPPSDGRTSPPEQTPADVLAVKPGDKWPQDSQFRWMIGELTIPESIEGHTTAGEPVGLRFNCGDGGEVWTGGHLQCRYDNDHPALALIAEKASPGQHVRVKVLVYGKVQGGDTFSQADLALIDHHRAIERQIVAIRSDQLGDAVPNGIVGLSQGGGMSDYDPATARKLREGGFRWFRMDNILTSVVGIDKTGKLKYDWSDLDKRLDFIAAVGAKPIFAASYMPQPFDAVPDSERHSAPRDYAQWEDLCYRAAKHAVDRGTPVELWEVWNETNAGWLKPGPTDSGDEPFAGLYASATGVEHPKMDLIRRFEAYCKLYAATARGVLRAEPSAKIGGPVLASGPYDDGKEGPGFNGKGFARGLMLWCAREKLPLDFLSWHEYFQGSDVIAKEAQTFRDDARQTHGLPSIDRPLMISEWNEAWWPDRPQDHELGAAWCADCITRAFIPHHIAYPCYFYVKQGDMNFRGDWSLLMQNNVPKASYNVAKIFNGLHGKWLKVTGQDGDISAVASWDAKNRRLAVVLVNFSYRYALRRNVSLKIDALPPELRGGHCHQWVVDATHSNVWNDPAMAELQKVGQTALKEQSLQFDRTLPANSVTLVELTP